MGWDCREDRQALGGDVGRELSITSTGSWRRAGQRLRFSEHLHGVRRLCLKIPAFKIGLVLPTVFCQDVYSISICTVGSYVASVFAKSE